MKKLLVLTAALIAQLTLLNSTAYAYMAVNETAEILPDNFFSIGVAPQITLSDNDYLDSGRFDTSVFVDGHIFDAVDARITAGTGAVDFWTEASVKWIPFPDVEGQPAMGIRGGLLYSREKYDNKNDSWLDLRVIPMLSKRSTTSGGDVIPYAAVPINIPLDGGKTALQFAVGAQWYPWRDIYVGTEFDLSLQNSFSSISAYIMFPFEGSTGYKKY